MNGLRPRETSGLTTRLILDYVERELGEKGVQDLIALSSVTYTESELRDENQWFSYELKHQLFDATVGLLGDANAPFKIGQQVLDFRVGAPLKLALKTFGSPKQVYRNVVTAAGKLTTTHSTKVIRLGDESALIRFKDEKGVGICTADREYNSGLLSCVPNLFGLPFARVRLVKFVDGPHGYCDYEVSWDSPRKSVARGAAIGLAVGGLFAVAIYLTATPWPFYAAAVVAPIIGGLTNGYRDRRLWGQRRLRELGDRLASQEERQRQLLASMRDLVSELKISEVLQKITKHAQVAVGGKQYALVLSTGGGRYVTSHSSDLPDSLRKTIESFVEAVASEGQSQHLLVDEVAVTPGLRALAEDLKMPIGSLCLAPLQYKSERLGFLVALSDRPQGFLPVDIDLLEMYAAQAAVALATARVLAQLEERASSDPLTGLRNHREFHERLSAEVEAASVGSSNIALLMLDLDWFKSINDRLGHREGDRILRLIGGCIMNAVPDSERAFRIGGDEFAVLLVDADDADARAVAKDIADTLPDGETKISVSFGIAQFPKDASTKDGLIRTADLALNRAKDDGEGEQGADQDQFAGHFQTAGEIEKIEMGRLSLQKQRRQLALANRLGSKLGRMVDPDQICRAVVEELHTEFHYYMATVKMLDKRESELKTVAGSGLVHERLGESGAYWIQPLSKGVVGRVVRTGETACIDDVRGDPDFIGSDFNVESRSELCAPIRVGGNIRGALNLEEPQVGAFDTDDVALVNTIADQMGSVLQSAKLYEELEHAYVATVEALSGALEAKDRYTASHAREIAETAVSVGRGLGLAESELKTLRYAALFHDIGKLGVPAEILNKDSKLNDDEFEQISQHTVIGEQILQPVPFLDAVTPLVRHAHERWDGKGYPDGLKGDDIPLGARVIFVCDAFHAMTSNRPYRKAMPYAEAMKELRAGAGTQFDPVVVDAFLDLLEDRSTEPELTEDSVQVW